MDLGGKFIVIDGPDGAGKGTQLDRLERRITQTGGTVVRAKDPGGTEIGDRIRHILLGYDLTRMDVRCETLLFMASRAQLVAEVVSPAIAESKTVLCDRFISATCAYQVAAGFAADDVISLGKLAVGDTWPHLTIILDLPVEIGFERTGRKPNGGGRRAGRTDRGGHGQFPMFDGAQPDAMEKRPLDFHRRVREIFRNLAGIYPAPVAVIDAAGPADQVHDAILAELERAFGR